MILRGAQIFGSPSGQLVDVLIDGGVITRVAATGEIASSPQHEEHALDGRVIHGGFWDEHVHMGLWSEYRKRVSLEQATSAREAAELMAAGAHTAGGEELLIGAGFRDGLWPDEKTAQLLDDHSAGRPWLLWSIDVHSCWLNSAAVRLLGVDHALPTGVLRERDAFALADKLSNVDAGVRDSWIAEAIAEANQRGVVGIVDFDFDDNHANWTRRRQGRNDWELRVEAAVYPDYFDQAIARGDSTGADIAPGVRVGPLKVITDGSLNTRTAYCCEPYRGIPGVEYGAMNYPTDELEGLMQRAKEVGFSPAFHAIGDEANRIVLDLFESVGLPGRIEHAQLLRKVDFSRFVSLGVTASVQPQHAVEDRDVADHYWSDRTDRVIALRSLLDAGAHLVFGSDAPVSQLHPLAQIAAAVTRTGDQRDAWEAQQRVTLAEAMHASARTSVAEGQPADLVVLGADPSWLSQALAGDPVRLGQAIRELPVELTIVEGRLTHDALS